MLQPKSHCSSRDPMPQESPALGAGTAERRTQPYRSTSALRPRRLPQNSAAEGIAGVYGCVFFKPPDRHGEASAGEAAVLLAPSGSNLPLRPTLKLPIRWGIAFGTVNAPSSGWTQSGANTKPRGKKQVCVSKKGL